MKVLFIGDVFGSAGRRVLAENLSRIKDKYDIHCCIVNGENSAGGRGITKNILKKMYKYGANIISGGNHSMAQLDVYDGSDLTEYLLRPMNFISTKRGKGVTLYTLPDGRKLGVINLQGRTFFKEKLNCPFKMGYDAVLTLRKETKNIIIDFHAEATSEKICLAHYMDGLVSALIGTHTHVQTADERILAKGTAFITDAGMTGPEASAIGMKYESVISRYLANDHVRFEPSNRGPMFNGVVVDINDDTGKARSITRIFERILFRSQS